MRIKPLVNLLGVLLFWGGNGYEKANFCSNVAVYDV